MAGDVWRALAAAIDGGDAKAFEKLLLRHGNRLRADFPARFTVPVDIREDHAAFQRYVTVTMAVAQRLGVDLPMVSQSDRLEQALAKADELAERGEHAAALAVVIAVVEADEPLSTPPEVGQALCYGRMGVFACELDRAEDAWLWTTRAQELCHRVKDTDGCLTYFLTLHRIAERSGTPEGALAVAGDALNHLQEHGPIYLLPRWLAIYTGSLRLAEGPEQVREFAATTRRYARELLGDNPDEHSKTLSNLGATLHRIGDDQAARVHYDEAILLRRAAGRPDHTLGVMLGNLGKVLIAVDDPQAEPVLTEALDLLAVGGGEMLDMTRTNLAVLYQRRGDHARADAIYRQVMAEGTPCEVMLRNFAALQRDTGDRVRERMLRDLADGAPATHSGDAADDTHLFSQLVEDAQAEHELGNTERAAELVHRADELAHRMADRSRWRAAVVTIMRAEIEEPVTEDELIVALAEAGGDPGCGQELLRSMRSNVGMWYIRQGRSEEALSHLMWASAGVDPQAATPNELGTLDRIALAHHKLAQYEPAEQMYRLALARRRELLGPSHPSVAQSLFNLGMLELGLGRTNAAAGHLREQFDIEDANLQEVFQASSEEQRLRYARSLRTNLDTFFVETMVYGDFVPAPELVDLLADAVLRRKAIVADALARDRTILMASPDKRVAAIAAELTETRHALQRLTLDGTGDLREDELRDRRRRLEMLLADRLGEGEDAPPLPTWQAVVAALPEDAALIEFYRLPLGEDDGYVSIVLTATAPPQFFMHDAASNLDEAIARWQDVLYSDHPAEPALGAELHRVLVERIAPALGGAHRLLISPDGHLNRLPFAAIPATDGTRLLDTYEIGHLTSGRDLLRHRPPTAPHDPIVLADPDYDLGLDTGTGVRFDPLPDTFVEGEWIARRVGGTFWSGAEATESRLRTVRSPLVLHLATHGFALGAPLRPSRSVPVTGPPPESAPGADPLLCTGLALAGANTWLAGERPPDGAEDGILTAADVYDLDLLGTELVVLSACATGLGEYQPGEGIFGLRRAFEIAGARSVVVSIWDVPSEPTVLLMREFYRTLLRGHSRAAALRAAQQTVRRRYPEPAAWAPFTLYGNPTPVPALSRT